ncbi:MAG TPA: hypothetical protein VJ807_10280 [Gaiellaceae bacterium]|nr:hypothetical protein [Gaiellaceae bacterium]
MAANDDTALEVEQYVLAHRVHALQNPAVHSACDTGGKSARVEALGLDALADEHLQPPGDAME